MHNHVVYHHLILELYSYQFGRKHSRTAAIVGYCRYCLVLHHEQRRLKQGFIGQERFGNMTRVYYKEAVGAFIVFDVTRVSTFEAVQKWKHDIDSKVICVLIEFLFLVMFAIDSFS